MARRLSQSKRGQALVLFTLSAILSFAILGLAVDIGWTHFRKEAAQAAADSAALAAAQAASVSSSGSPVCGANSVVCQAATACPAILSSPPTDNLLAGCLYAKSNGFVASGSQNVTIAANTTSPPPSAPGAAVKYWVNVSITETQAHLFSSILGNKYLTVGATATAAMLPGGGGCIYVMDPSGSSVTNSGSALLQSACRIYINSSSASAVAMSGSATIKTTGGATTNIVGNPGLSARGGATITPAANAGVAAAADPYASMNPPAVGACTHSSAVVVTTNQTLGPGTYCGGIVTSGTETITLNSGLYIIKSGITESGSPTFNGAGVTLYFPTGGITGSGSGGFNLSAPASGLWPGAPAGIVIYEDRSNSSGITLSGSTGTQISGVVYMPKGNLTYSGYSGSGGVASTIVVNDIVFSGTSYINNSGAGGGGGGGVSLIR